MKRNSLITNLCLVLAVTFAAGCREKKQRPPMPTPTVTVMKAQTADVIKYKYYTGNAVASQSVELRARIPGFLEEVKFSPGARVKENDLLFVIEQAPYKAAVDGAKAALEVKQAELKLAEASLSRKEKAFKDQAISEIELLEAKATYNKAVASIKAAKAKLETAEVNYSYTEVRSPVDGRVGRNLVDKGSIVGVGGSTLLSTVVDSTPIFIYFPISEKDLQTFVTFNNQYKKSQQKKVGIGLSAGPDYPFSGIIDFMDNKVDKDTGTIMVRAVIENDDERLVPGFYAKLRIPGKEFKDALMIPEAAVSVDQQGHFVLVVDDKNIVHRRNVTKGVSEKSLVQIVEGISATDRVIVKGIQKSRPGAKVNALNSGEQSAQPKKPAHK